MTPREGLEYAAQNAPRELLERFYTEGETAKQLLRQAGIGWIGLGLLETVREGLRDRSAILKMLVRRATWLDRCRALVSTNHWLNAARRDLHR